MWYKHYRTQDNTLNSRSNSTEAVGRVILGPLFPRTPDPGSQARDPRSGVPEWLSNIGEFKPDNVILALGTLGLGLPDPSFWTPIWTPF